MASIGKSVFDELYVHLSGLVHLDTVQQQRIADAVLSISPTACHTPNVAKVNIKTGRLSLLAYRDFDECCRRPNFDQPGSLMPTEY
jgi:hypothetical protein